MREKSAGGFSKKRSDAPTECKSKGRVGGGHLEPSSHPQWGKDPDGLRQDPRGTVDRGAAGFEGEGRVKLSYDAERREEGVRREEA